MNLRQIAQDLNEIERPSVYLGVALCRALPAPKLTRVNKHLSWVSLGVLVRRRKHGQRKSLARYKSSAGNIVAALPLSA